ncbi:hypothetical protein [Aquihabitans sp. McL0605]|uniref:hypothetical protein n=1 Tax=Aquihabitans sp. McL0605 TaxID=3415671 RepID=UPI003CEE1774
MARRSHRRRKVASPAQLRILRAAGWRFSPTRDAWVHRVLGGRIGPVFRDQDAIEGPARIDDDLARSMHAAIEGWQEPAPLPTRPDATDPADQAPPTTPATRPTLTRVLAQLAPDELPRTVLVDGRPPRPGTVPEQPVLTVATDTERATA